MNAFRKVPYNSVMDAKTAQKLNALNQEFYAKNAASFSATRSHPWEGWKRLRPAIGAASNILDVACGNLRFERFASMLKGEGNVEFDCVDSCAELAPSLPGIHFQKLDIVELCINGGNIAKAIHSPACDFVVSFGFLHHVPGFEARCRLIEALLEKTVQGGRVALSLWQFMEDDRLARKALATTARARHELDLDLDENDYILGWQDDGSAYRYCHNYTDDEISELLFKVSDTCQLEFHYNSDGRNNALNTYVVLRKK